jgi:two-component system chemotaxis response regulator CheB
VTDKIKVIIVDDSALVRQMLTQMLSSDPQIEVVAACPDPLVARQKIKELNPDVITLDIEMPNMDGLSFLDKIMRLRPMPVVMISSLTQKGAEITLQALEMGAVDFVGKPTTDLRNGLGEKSDEIVSKVKAAARARVHGHRAEAAPARVIAPAASTGYKSADRVVAIGSSTGGVEALSRIISTLPADCPPIVITQHMPGNFTSSFAQRLDRQSQLSVKEAADGDRLVAGHAYLAPGNFHLEVVRAAGGWACKVYDGEPVSGHRPSVDVLFRSVAASVGDKATGVILTGMGRDGAEGLKLMRDAGAHTVGQDEATCVVYGMPRAAAQIGAVKAEMPLGNIAAEILKSCQKH